MKTSYDTIAQAGYIQISSSKIEKSIPVSSSIVCDVDNSGMIVGIEILEMTQEQLQNFEKSLKESSFQVYS